MLVSFYVQISIITMSLVLVLLPFVGLPPSLDKALTTVFAFLILGISVYALYGGYVRILKREEKRLEQQQQKEKKTSEELVELTGENDHVHPDGRGAESKERSYSSLYIARD